VLASDVTSFLVFRLAQGIVVAGTVLSSAIIRDLFDTREAAARMGAISAAMGLAPMLGPMLGGFLDTAVGWRAIFGLYTGLGAVALVLVWLDLGETRHRDARPLRRADYAALLGSVRYWGYVLCQSFGIGAFYVFLAGAPFVASHVFALSPAMVGVGLGSITGGFILGATLTARLAPRLGIARLIVAGRLVPLAGLTVGLALFLGGLSHPLILFGTTITVGVGNGLTLSNANAGAMSVRPDLAGTAAGLAGALSIAIGAGLTWVSAAVVAWQTSPLTLLTMMIGCIAASFAAGLVAIRLDRVRGPGQG
jgi:DHA1 family bicyclomycin/chloramphenicol resistance-like MFS transporter